MTAPVRKRTRARELAVQALYQLDVHQRIAGGPTEAARNEAAAFIDSDATDSEVRQFALELVAGAIESRDQVDAVLSSVVSNWKLDRIAATDRAILRLAAYEILARTDIPPKAAINEAINLAKKFSTAQSGAFVNGVLDKILELRGSQVKSD